MPRPKVNSWLGWRIFTVNKRWRLVSNSDEPFRRHRSSLAEGEHTIVFASSISFHFAIPVHVWRSSPSNLYLPSFLCSVAVTMTELQSIVWRPPSCRLRFRPSLPLLVAGEDLHEFPFIFSLSFAPRPSHRPPPPPVTRTLGAPVRLLFVPGQR
jgi:hypothetical protein